MDRRLDKWKGERDCSRPAGKDEGWDRAVGEMGGGTTTAELSSLVRVYFSRDYKRS